MSIDETRPAYRVINPSGFFGPNDTLYLEGEELYYDGEPNEGFEPLNQPAQAAMQAFYQKLDDAAREVALKTNRPFTGRPKTVDGGYAMARAVEQAQVPVMGHLEQKIVTTVAPVEKAAVPETTRRGRGRPRTVNV